MSYLNIALARMAAWRVVLMIVLAVALLTLTRAWNYADELGPTLWDWLSPLHNSG